CGTECLAQEYGMIDSDGNMVISKSMDNMITNIANFGDENDIKNWSKLCTNIANEKASKEEGSFVCNRNPLLFVLCLYDVRNFYCPEEEQVKDDKCDERRNKLKAVFPQ
ncbi:hypothetical protein L9F63_017272, partial [Diploptera punctata]